MPSIRNKTGLTRCSLGSGSEATAFLQDLAPDLKEPRGELFSIQSGGELEWTHTGGREAFFFATCGAVVVETGGHWKVLKELSLLWLEAGDGITLHNEGSEEAELLYLESSFCGKMICGIP